MSRKEPTFENALRFASDLIRIPSPSGEEEAVARRVAEEMEALGYDRVRIDDLGSVVGVVEGSGGAPSILLSSHLDVVAEGDPDAWEHPPFSGEVADGFLHGRGAMDIKGPLALQTYAAVASREDPAGDVIVAHTVFEEQGGWGMRHLLESGAVEPAAVIIGEATAGDVAIGHRGRAEIEVVIRGVAGHASAPERAANALDPLGAVLDAVRRLATNQPTDPVLGPATLVATSIEATPESRNVVPDRVVVALDWRILPGMDAEALLGRVRDTLAPVESTLADRLGIEVRLARREQRSWTGRGGGRELLTPGYLLDPDHPVAAAAARAAGRRGGEGAATLRPWTFATDGGWSGGVHGIPTVGFAPGEERFAHTNRERLDVEEARWVFERYPDVIGAIQRTVAE